MQIVQKTKAKWKHSLALAGVMIAAIPAPAWAQAANQTEVDTMVQSILNLLTGPIAMGLAMIALVLAGIMFFFGHGNKALLGSIIVGCFIVFGADWIVGTISGT